MLIIQSIFQILAAYGLLFLMGLGLALYCMPERLREFSIFIAPAVGYIAFCFLSIWISGVTDGAIVRTNLWTLLALLGVTVLALIVYRSEILKSIPSAKAMALFTGVMLACVFWPVLQQGLDFYIGTANPDFYQSLSFHEALIKFAAKFWVVHTDLPLHGPFQEYFPAAFQARFGGVVLSVLFEQLSGMPARTALTTSVIVFLLCLPGTAYFFCRTVLEFGKREAVLAAILVAVSASTTMSFVHTFIGQNSALATFPLAIGLIYLALKERSIKLIFLTAIVLNGMFWLYVMALPYVLAPFGLYAAIKFFKQGLRDIGRWLFVIIVFVAMSALVHASVYGESLKFIKDLVDLLGKLTQSQYYADFLTEEVFEYATGLTSYPLSQSMFFHAANHMLAPALTGMLLACVYFSAVRVWSKTASQDAVILTLSLIATYVVVWGNYTFLVLYGYASFKMTAWLQFIAAPFFAWYMLRNWELIKGLPFSAKSWRPYLLLILLVPIYTLLNLASDLDYGLKSFGRDRIQGSLINSYGIAGNREFVELPAKLRSSISGDSSVALGFGDSIENDWVAYYASRAVSKVAILAHEEIPFEDAYLPDIHSRKYNDSMGQAQIDKQKYLNNGVADYYLLPGNDNLNTEIIDGKPGGVPLWSNATFALYKKADIKDLIVLGRGYYRVEHMDTSRIGWWWPEVFRWSAAGGEIYQFMPSMSGKPYRVAFSAITGLGQSSGKRTIEVWHNGKQIDEIVVEGAGRFVSRAYLPADGINRIVLRVKEPSIMVPRNAGLWNRHLPDRSTPINILFSHIRVLNENQDSSGIFPDGNVIEPKTLFDLVETFNGFDVDGWVRDRGNLSIRASPLAIKAELKILVPGNLQFGFPYSVQFKLNDTLVERSFATPGEYTVVVDLPKRPASGILRLEIVPQEAKRLAEGMTQREVLQSIRLSSIKFLTH